MIKFLGTYRSVLSASLLASFLSALGSIMFCNLEGVGFGSDHAPIDQQSIVTNEPYDIRMVIEHQSFEESEDHSYPECCDSQSDIFLLGLVSQGQTNFAFIKNLHFETFALSTYTNLHPRRFLNIKIDVILNNLPPPKISDIRIFIQSFLN